MVDYALDSAGLELPTDVVVLTDANYDESVAANSLGWVVML